MFADQLGHDLKIQKWLRCSACSWRVQFTLLPSGTLGMQFQFLVRELDPTCLNSTYWGWKASAIPTLNTHSICPSLHHRGALSHVLGQGLLSKVLGLVDNILLNTMLSPGEDHSPCEIWWLISAEEPGGKLWRVCMHAQLVSRAQLWDLLDFSYQVPLIMGFPKQEYWSGLPLPPPGDLPSSEIKPKFPVSLPLAGGFFTTVLPGKPKLWRY